MELYLLLALAQRQNNLLVRLIFLVRQGAAGLRCRRLERLEVDIIQAAGSVSVELPCDGLKMRLLGNVYNFIVPSYNLKYVPNSPDDG